MPKYRLLSIASVSLFMLFPAQALNGQTGSGSVTVTSRASTAKVATLQQQLEKGRRLRRPNEFEYAERVATLVQRGQLPLKLVQGSFNYARRRDHRRYPFVYFQRVLDLRAKKIGVTILPTVTVR